MTLRNITCAVTLCLLTLSGQAVGKTEVPPYKNKSLSIEKRVDDLMGRMTLREKVLQLQNRGAGRLDETVRVMAVPTKWVRLPPNVLRCTKNCNSTC